jgi:hypothetical protein
MRDLRSRSPEKRRLSPELRRALQLLASNPRGTTDHTLVLGHGFSRDILAMLVLGGLATVVTEALSADGMGYKVERMLITDAGKRVLEG